MANTLRRLAYIALDILLIAANEKGKLTNDYPNSNKFHIKIDSRTDLYIMKLKSGYVMIERFSDNTCKRYETKSADIYTSADNERLKLKKS